MVLIHRRVKWRERMILHQSGNTHKTTSTIEKVDSNRKRTRSQMDDGISEAIKNATTQLPSAKQGDQR